MAGSAKVTPTPRIPIITKTTGIDAFCGRLDPITLPKGMRPEFKPSMKAASPTITANKPTNRVVAACTGYCKTKI